jgi:hypothetical protein
MMELFLPLISFDLSAVPACLRQAKRGRQAQAGQTFLS